ncbi:hypothetical protein ACA910_003627 [Epithemia clementina (nom. ined.)]
MSHDDRHYGERQEELRHVLQTTGLLAVHLPLDFESNRQAALHGLCQCHQALQQQQEDSLFSSLRTSLKDDPSTLRTTIATSTVGAHGPLPLFSSSSTTAAQQQEQEQEFRSLCGSDTMQAMEELRDQAAMVTNAFVSALDQLLLLSTHSTTLHPPPLLRNTYQGMYPTLASIQASAVHLEHFHVYSKQNTTSTNANSSHKDINNKNNNTLKDEEQEQEPTSESSFEENSIYHHHDQDDSHRRSLEEHQEQQQGQQRTEPTLNWHTDAGLFLTFVPAMDCRSAGDHQEEEEQQQQQPDSLSSSFWVYDDNQRGKVAVQFPANSVILMLGAGAEHWLQTPPHLKLKATRHAVHMQPGQVRAWYGMMTMVPDIAIVQQSPQQTFADMKQQMSRRSSRHGDDGGDDDAISIGCGHYEPLIAPSSLHDYQQNGGRNTMRYSHPQQERRRLLQVQNANACDNVTSFFCWMSCLDIPDAEHMDDYLEDDYSLYCMDPHIYKATSGTNPIAPAVEPCQQGMALNPDCTGQWAKTSPIIPGYDLQRLALNAHQQHDHQEQSNFSDDAAAYVASTTTTSTNSFCSGGTSMYMNGFQWMDTTCVIFLFPQWVLSSRGKFAVACIATLLFGSMLEWIMQERRKLAKKKEMAASAALVGGGLAYYNIHNTNHCYYWILSSLLYAIQLTIGYFIMLIVMTYNVPLFICSVLGLVAGNCIFTTGSKKPASFIARGPPTMKAYQHTPKRGSSPFPHYEEVERPPPEGILKLRQQLRRNYFCSDHHRISKFHDDDGGGGEPAEDGKQEQENENLVAFIPGRTTCSRRQEDGYCLAYGDVENDQGSSLYSRCTAATATALTRATSTSTFGATGSTNGEAAASEALQVAAAAVEIKGDIVVGGATPCCRSV